LLNPKTALLSVLLAFSSLQSAYTQIPDATQPQIPGAPPHEREDPWTVQQRKEMEKKRNEIRQEDLKKDTEKLLELATELKQYVDKSNENTLSLDVIKKADQIEKLAKSVKEKSKRTN
jgi:spore coat polysaccharide biosynthesis protein SpsF (cytidylyltransferase family)